MILALEALIFTTAGLWLLASIIVVVIWARKGWGLKS